MAIDSRNRRASAVNVGLFWRGMLSTPAGTVGKVARIMDAALYAGFSGTEISLTNVFATGAVGTLVVSANAGVTLIGVTATGTLGSMTIAVAASVTLTGVTVNGMLGNILVWGPVPPPPSGNWVSVPGGPAGGWSAVSSGPAGGWTPVVT